MGCKGAVLLYHMGGLFIQDLVNQMLVLHARRYDFQTHFLQHRLLAH